MNGYGGQLPYDDAVCAVTELGLKPVTQSSLPDMKGRKVHMLYQPNKDALPVTLRMVVEDVKPETKEAERFKGRVGVVLGRVEDTGRPVVCAIWEGRAYAGLLS